MACVCWPLLASLGAIIYQLRLSKDHMPLSIACLRISLVRLMSLMTAVLHNHKAHGILTKWVG